MLPPKLVFSLSKKILGLGDLLCEALPNLKEDLIQAEIEIKAREWAAISLVVGFSNTLIVLLILSLLMLVTKLNLFWLVALFSIMVFFASLVTVLFYPKIIVSKRMRRLENDLIPACRQLLIELKSGVSLFQALASVSSDYGEVSKEFRKIVKRINSGIPEIDALSDASREAPSFSFRRVLWQVSNALKIGSDIGSALEIITKDLEREQADKIRKYGQELSPWTMIYMMAAVVVPSLGITLVIVIMSFLNISLPSFSIYLVIIYLIIFQLFYMNFISSRRPYVGG